MKIEAEQVLCRFHITNRVRHRSEPLYQWIVETARRRHLQGATVLKGIMGLQPDGAILREKTWAVAQNLPVVVEIVDRPQRIEALLAEVEPAFHDGAITLERAHVILYRTAKDEPKASSRDAIAAPEGSAVGEVRTMKTSQAGLLLRIFIGDSDHGPGGEGSLYEAIVKRAREAGLAGATVLRGPMGFGKHSLVHAAKVLELSTDLPVVVEIVDSEEKIRAFIPIVDILVSEGLVTLEAVRILKYAAPGA
jgi:PII-like signaling protein